MATVIDHLGVLAASGRQPARRRRQRRHGRLGVRRLHARGAVVQEALAAIKDGKPRLLDFGVSDEQALDVGLACGGASRSSSKVAWRDEGRCSPWQQRAASRRHPGYAAAAAAGSVGCNGGLAGDAAALAAARRGRSVAARPLDVGGRQDLPQCVRAAGAADRRRRRAHRAGAGADGAARRLRTSSTRAAPWPRAARFPGVKVVQEWPDEAFDKIGLDVSTAVVTLTHDPKLDDPALEAALRAACLLRRRARHRHPRQAQGPAARGRHRRRRSSRASTRRSGSDIGAKSPAEIAVAILGQIIERAAATRR